MNNEEAIKILQNSLKGNRERDPRYPHAVRHAIEFMQCTPDYKKAYREMCDKLEGKEWAQK